ncbi:hypothetical protein D3C81_1235050 [compost metagenome]
MFSCWLASGRPWPVASWLVSRVSAGVSPYRSRSTGASNNGALSCSCTITSAAGSCHCAAKACEGGSGSTITCALAPLPSVARAAWAATARCGSQAAASISPKGRDRVQSETLPAGSRRRTQRSPARLPSSTWRCGENTSSAKLSRSTSCDDSRASTVRPSVRSRMAMALRICGMIQSMPRVSSVENSGCVRPRCIEK